MFRRPRAVIAAAGLPPTPGQASFGVTGWQAFGHGQHASEQVGAYAGTMLTQYPTNLPGVQLRCGVEGLRSGWYYPVAVPIQNGSVQQTQAFARAQSAQRFGSRYTGPMGPIASQQMTQRVTIAQIKQSGVQAMQWAQSLGKPANPATATQQINDGS